MEANAILIRDVLSQELIGHVVPRSFSGGYVALSYVVSVLGAASTLELLHRRTSAKGKLNR